jgi:gamma-glutamyl-gamma-aminobutyrate hydrolase PuuD
MENATSKEKQVRPKALVLGFPGYAGIVKDALGADYDVEVCNLYEPITEEKLKQYSLIQFCGGEDVSPHLYGAVPHPYTQNSRSRDAWESNVFDIAKKLGIPMAGICRGSQFLNVMCGGAMHQHVDGHGIRYTHGVITKTGEFEVTSTHHQISILGKGAKLLAWCDEVLTGQPEITEVEAFEYPDYQVFGVQFHPEYMDRTSTAYKWYSSKVRELVNKARGEV